MLMFMKKAVIFCLFCMVALTSYVCA